VSCLPCAAAAFGTFGAAAEIVTVAELDAANERCRRASTALTQAVATYHVEVAENARRRRYYNVRCDDCARNEAATTERVHAAQRRQTEACGEAQTLGFAWMRQQAARERDLGEAQAERLVEGTALGQLVQSAAENLQNHAAYGWSVSPAAAGTIAGPGTIDLAALIRGFQRGAGTARQDGVLDPDTLAALVTRIRSGLQTGHAEFDGVVAQLQWAIAPAAKSSGSSTVVVVVAVAGLGLAAYLLWGR